MTAVQFRYLFYYARHPLEMIRNRKCFIKTMRQMADVGKMIRREYDIAAC